MARPMTSSRLPSFTLFSTSVCRTFMGVPVQRASLGGIQLVVILFALALYLGAQAVEPLRRG